MSDSTAPAEQTFVENPFGTVTSKRVIYYRAKGWFSGGSREDIPLQHVLSPFPESIDPRWRNCLSAALGGRPSY